MRSICCAVLWAAGLLVIPDAARADVTTATLMEQGHWKQVRAIAQAGLKARPEDPEAHYLMGSVLMKWGDSNAAMPYAEKAVALAPQNAQYHWLLARIAGDQAERASLFKQLGLARRFRSETETVLRLDPRHIEGHFGMMVYYFKAPGIVGGDKKKAYAEADEIMKIDRAKGYMALVRLAQEEKQPQKLEDLYKKALEADPKTYEAHIGLVNVYAGAQPRNPTAVEAHARQAIAIEPKRISGYNGLAWALVAQKRWADLDATIADAERAVPDDSMPYFIAGLALLREGEDFPRAERYFRKYLTQEREAGQATHAATQWRLGQLLEKAGRKAEAIAAMEAAVKADPSLEPAKKDLKRLKG
jgi:tetratricopeptide (TPR) repeat protein